jgi:hypothetical protein
MDRSLALILLLGAVLASPGQAAPLCADPGADGVASPGGVINRYVAAPAGASLQAGQRDIPLGPARGPGDLHPGDLLLLWQVQGAVMIAANDHRYGVTASQAGQFEWLRVEQVGPDRVRVRGAGVDGGLLHDYPVREPPDARQVTAAGAGPVPTLARWQLVRVPQYEQATLAGDLRPLPWDGQSGGLLALDVRRGLRLAGYSLDAGGAGFRGGAGLALQGALATAGDYRYPAPGRAELAAGYGQHGSKGEGFAGTPRWVWQDGTVPDTRPEADRRGVGDGYPGGSMARGAPGNAGGGGNSPLQGGASGGGGGAGGEPGLAGGADGGLAGKAVPAEWPVLMPGGGGGAGSPGGGVHPAASGGAGGGVIVVRAGQFPVDDTGTVNVRGAAGLPGPHAGGGGGGGGTLLLMAGDGQPAPWLLQREGGAGGEAPAPGGAGGAGRLPAVAAEVGETGVAPGFVCQPAGTLISGRIETLAQQGQAVTGLPGWPLQVTDAAGRVLVEVTTQGTGEFRLRLPERHAGTDLYVRAPVPPGWQLAARTPARWVDGQGWRLPAGTEIAYTGLRLQLLREGRLEPPPPRVVAPGATELLPFRFQAGSDSQVRFHYVPPAGAEWEHALLLDPTCQGESLYQDISHSRWLSVEAGAAVCVRLRLRVPLQTEPAVEDALFTLEAEVRAPDTGVDLPRQDASVHVMVMPRD